MSAARKKQRRSSSSTLLIVDSQSVKNTDTAGLKGDDASCRIPDDWIDKKRYPLFMARDVLRGLVQSLQSTGKP